MMHLVTPPAAAAWAGDRRPHWRIVLVMLMLSSWLLNGWQPVHSAAHAQASTPRPQQSASAQADAPAPLIVDGCPDLSPHDAAALLQEPVNAAEPIGNLIFGPLRAEFTPNIDKMQGLCGYTNATPLERDTLDRSQPHLLTDLPYAHAVVSAHIAFAQMGSADGPLHAPWYDLLALVELLGANNPAYDSQAEAAKLSEPPAFWHFIDTMQAVAVTSDTQIARPLTILNTYFNFEEIYEPYEELFWVWQPLTDGYFALLIARTQQEYDLVAARLGSNVNEQSVLGHARVILKRMRSQAALLPKPEEPARLQKLAILYDPPPPQASTGLNVTGLLKTLLLPPSSANSSGSMLTFSCTYLSADDVAAMVGDAVLWGAVSNPTGIGCRYEPDTARPWIPGSQFSNVFDSYGLLAGIIHAQASQEILTNVVAALADNNDAVKPTTADALRARIAKDDYGQVLTQIGAIDWQLDELAVESLAAVDDETLLLHTALPYGGTRIYLFHPRPAGGLYYLSGTSTLAMADLRQPLIEATRKLLAAAAKEEETFQ